MIKMSVSTYTQSLHSRTNQEWENNSDSDDSTETLDMGLGINFYSKLGVGRRSVYKPGQESKVKHLQAKQALPSPLLTDLRFAEIPRPLSFANHPLISPKTRTPLSTPKIPVKRRLNVELSSSELIDELLETT